MELFNEASSNHASKIIHLSEIRYVGTGVISGFLKVFALFVSLKRFNFFRTDRHK